jgi:glycosyltransferase involved in cell wall biosynthesis
MLMASVDVAVPCYQYGRYLHGCVTSVLSQEIQDLRVLIIDNASTDNSVEVARQLAAEDRRVEVVAHPTNQGQHASFNEAIDWAKSDYFMILCADDLLARGALPRACSVMERRPDVVLSYGRTLFVSSSDPIPALDERLQEEQWRILSGRELLERFCNTGRGLSGPMVIVRTSAQKQVGYYRPELPHTDDFELWMRFACLGGAAETHAVQTISRMHFENRSGGIFNVHQWNLHCEAAFESFFAREGASAPEAKGLHQVARRNLAERAYWGGIANLLRGDRHLGLELLRFAFSRSPRIIVIPPLGHLFRRDDVFDKLIEVAATAARRVVHARSGKREISSSP